MPTPAPADNDVQTTPIAIDLNQLNVELVRMISIFTTFIVLPLSLYLSLSPSLSPSKPDAELSHPRQLSAGVSISQVNNFPPDSVGI